MPRAHEIERHIDDAGFAEGVHLRPTMVMQNHLGIPGLTSGHEIHYPFGEFAVPEVDARDVADVAVTFIEAERLPRRTVLELTGPEALSYRAIADVLARETGVPFTYSPVTDDDRAGIVHPGAGLHLTQLRALFATGFGTHPSGHVELALGRPAIGHAQFARDHAAEFVRS